MKKENAHILTGSSATAEKKLIVDKEKGTIILEVEISENCWTDIQEDMEKCGLQKKSEFHTTIIGSQTAESILEKIKDLNHGEQKAVQEKILTLAQGFHWRYHVKKEYWIISKDYPESEKRQSIIQVIDLPSLNYFYIELNNLLGTSFETPFPHITLCSKSSKDETMLRGIGIYTQQEFNILKPTKIWVPEY